MWLNAENLYALYNLIYMYSTISETLTWELVFLLDSILSRFFPISSKSESLSELDPSSVDNTSSDARTLQNFKMCYLIQKWWETFLSRNSMINSFNITDETPFFSKILLHLIQDTREASFHLTLTKDMNIKYDFTCSEDQIFSGILLYTFLDVLLLRICFLLQTYSFQLCMKSTFLISYLFNEVCPKNFHTMILPYLFPPDRPWLALLT